MRELDNSVADTMRTSSQTEAENYDLDFLEVEAGDVSEFGQNPNHLEEPPRCEDCGNGAKPKQINVYVDLDVFKLLVPAAAIAGMAMLALGYRKQVKLIDDLKTIKNQTESLKKD